MLGLALTRLLIQKGIRVAVLVNPASPRKNNIQSDPLVEMIECGLSDLGQAKARLKEEDYDAFFHFGWEGTFGDARDDMYLQTRNINHTLDAVKLAAELGCSVFVGAGSQAEYGRVSGRLTPDMKTEPENGYGIAKLCAGRMSRIACQRQGMRHIWVRVLSTYGPFDGMHTMVASGIRQLLLGEPPSYTKGEQMWDYLYCDDAANAFYLSALKGRDGAVYCLGSGKARPLKEYITEIRDIVSPGAEIRLGERPYAKGQVMYLCADITALREDTGFKPETPFKEGVIETLRWIRKNEGL